MKWIFAILVLVGCASVDQKLDVDYQYRRDIGLTVDGKLYDGIAVLPAASRYDITIAPPKAKMSTVIFKTCHRDDPFEPEQKTFLFWSVGKGQYQYVFEPKPGLEDNRVCPLLIDSFDSASGKHAWAHIEFENPMYTVQGMLTCNAKDVAVNGVGLCQAKERTVQRIRFYEPVRFAPPEPSECAAPKKVNGAYEIAATSREKCLYHFDTQDGKLGRLTIIGYEGVLVRETQ